MADRYDEIVEQLLKLTEPGFGGRPRPDLVGQIDRLTRELEKLAGHDGYVSEKAANLREWVGRACSQRRYAQWGLQRVESFAYEDAYRLKNAWKPPEARDAPGAI